MTENGRKQESMKRAQRALGHNFADVLRYGPRLSYNRKTAVVATCKATNRMLLTGLGGMGVGTMWFGYDAKRVHSAPDFATEREASEWFYQEFWAR